MPRDMFYGASPKLFENAKKLREAMTPAELILWDHIRNNKLKGFRFKAQHPIAYFVADFYCHSARLVIELDGSIHDSVEQQEYDGNRTFILEEFGLTVLRFKNQEVTKSIDKVLTIITKHLSAIP